MKKVRHQGLAPFSWASGFWDLNPDSWIWIKAIQGTVGLVPEEELASTTECLASEDSFAGLGVLVSRLDRVLLWRGVDDPAAARQEIVERVGELWLGLAPGERTEEVARAMLSREVRVWLLQWRSDKEHQKGRR